MREEGGSEEWIYASRVLWVTVWKGFCAARFAFTDEF